MFVTNWISTTKIQKTSEITNFFRHYFLSRTEVKHTYFIHVTHQIGFHDEANKRLPEGFEFGFDGMEIYVENS